MLEWEGVTPNAETPFPPQHPTRVTTSLERDLVSCRISITRLKEKLDFMWRFFTSAFLAKFDVTLQQGRHWESKCSWLSSAGPCSLPRLIPGQGPLWHQQTFREFTEMLGTERSIKIECWTLPWLQGAEPHHGRAAAAIHTVPKDQVT